MKIKRRTKILLILLAVILLAQIPYVYRRYQIGQLSNVKRSNLAKESADINIPKNPKFNEYKGIIHAHTNLGGHSRGTFDELINGASVSGVNFVVMTEHTAENFDSSAKTLNGIYKNVLFVGGHEADTISGDRFLLVSGSADAFSDAKLETPQFLEKYHTQNKIALITYPEKFKSWNANFDGIEVFSLHTNAKKNTPILAIPDFLWSFPSYPEMTLARFFVRPDENLQKFDEISQQRKITLFAGTDAHSNIGFHIFGDDAGNKLINFKFDRYETIFRLVRAHVLLAKDKELTAENLIEAIKNGHLFIGFDVLSNTDGFSFSAENDAESRIMGDEIALGESVNLKAFAPLKSRFVLLKNGEKINETPDATEMNFQAKEKGVYRVEVYLDSLGGGFEKMPWIISNPIYVR